MKKYAPLLLRIGIGGLFLTAGIMKLLDPAMVTGMLDGFGFPFAAFWTWLLILAEVVCGAGVLTGFKLKWVTPPLAVILLVAVSLGAGGLGVVLSNIALLFAVASLWFQEPGMWSIKA